MVRRSAALGETIWFAHWLRAWSVLVVMFVHLGVSYWAHNPAMATQFGHVAPPSSTATTDQSWSLLHHDSLHTYGLAAVGFFFLISGFLIPTTLEGRTIARFLVTRILRVYPVWVVGLLLAAGFYAFISWRTGVPIGLSRSDWLANALVIPDLTDATRINPVIWTLLIETKFYVLCALMAATVGFHRWWAFAAIVVGWTGYAVWAWGNIAVFGPENTTTWRVSQALAWDAKHVMLIFAGVCYYNLARNGWNWLQTSSMILLCFVCTSITHRQVLDTYGSRKEWYIGYVAALVVFILVYAARGAFGPSRIVGYVAEMAYPLYAVHFIAGTILITMFLQIASPVVSTIGAVVIVFAIAAVIHEWVELPAIRLAKMHRKPRRPHGYALVAEPAAPAVPVVHAPTLGAPSVLARAD